MISHKFYSIDSGNSTLYLAVGSDSALRKFIEMYFHSPIENLSERQIQQIPMAQAYRAPFFDDFKKTSNHSEDFSFCLGCVLK